MAQVGLCKPYYAQYTAENGTVSYAGGAKLAKAVSVSITPDSTDPVEFYADNGICESANIFTSGTLTLSVDSLSYSAAAAIFGLTVESSTTPEGSLLKYPGSMNAPYLGFGVVLKNIVSGASQWVAIVLPKIKFKIPTISQDTQAKTITFTAPELEATIMRDDTAAENWKIDGYFSTEDAAEAYVKSYLNIT